MALNDQLAAQVASLDRAILRLERPAGDPAEIRALAAQLLQRAEATRSAGTRAASLPGEMDFTGPAAIRYAGHASECGAVAGATADRLTMLSQELQGQARQLQRHLDAHQLELRHLTAQRDDAAARLKGQR